MKNIIKITMLMIVALTVLAACDSNNEITKPPAAAQVASDDYTIVDARHWVTVFEQNYPIYAGQNIEVGTMQIINDQDYLYLNLYLNDGWAATLSHLHIATSLAGIPQNKKGIPVPGQFEYSESYSPAKDMVSYQFPLDDLGFEIGETMYIAAHLDVSLFSPTGIVIQSETAWSGDQAGPGPRWWFYATYSLQEEARRPGLAKVEKQTLVNPEDNQ
jgi:hypothetical protein